MSARDLLPRIVIVVIFLSGAVFAYIESVYMQDHAASLGDKGSSVQTWMWIYRVIALALLFGSAFIVGGMWRR